MTHKQKLKMARKMVGGHTSAIEVDRKRKTMRKIKVIPFNNPTWNERKKAISKRVKKQQGAAHKRAVKRKLKK